MRLPRNFLIAFVVQRAWWEFVWIICGAAEPERNRVDVRARSQLKLYIYSILKHTYKYWKSEGSKPTSLSGTRQITLYWRQTFLLGQTVCDGIWVAWHHGGLSTDGRGSVPCTILRRPSVVRKLPPNANSGETDFLKQERWLVKRYYHTVVLRMVLVFG